jgi:hypothetical protein
VKTIASHEAPENPTALSESAGFLRLATARLRLAAAAAAPSPRRRDWRTVFIIGKITSEEHQEAAIGPISFPRAGKDEGEGFSAPLAPQRTRSMPAPAVTGAAIASAPKGNAPFGQPVCSIPPSIPRNDGHHVLVALTEITAEIGIEPAVPLLTDRLK